MTDGRVPKTLKQRADSNYCKWNAVHEVGLAISLAEVMSNRTGVAVFPGLICRNAWCHPCASNVLGSHTCCSLGGLVP